MPKFASDIPPEVSFSEYVNNCSKTMLSMNSSQEKQEQQELTLDAPSEALDKEGTDQERKRLVVYNDDHNTMEHVIETLMRVCRHSRIQAEQCTYIIHFKGKCAVRQGTYALLRPMRIGIIDAGIQAEVV